MDNLIIKSEQNGVLTLTLNRLDKKNALTSSMYLSLCEHFHYAENNSNIHCLLLQGDDTCFCGGNDLNDFLNYSANDKLAAFDFVKAIARFSKPIVVAVAGPAIGIGTTLLLHSDIIVAAPNTKFALPFCQLGLCPEAASSALLTQLVGHAKAFELLILGDVFTAEQALSMSLINQIVPADKLLTTATHYAKRVAQLPSDSVLSSRQLLKQSNKVLVEQALSNELEIFSRLMQTDDCKNILKKFFRS